MAPRRITDEGDGWRQLWSSVVLMAASDLQEEPFNSTEYCHSVSFFTGAGSWAEWRAFVGGMINLHGDDLKRMGQKIIDRRIAERRAQGLVEHRVRPVVRAPAAAEPIVIPDVVRRLRDLRERNYARRHGCRTLRPAHPQVLDRQPVL